MEAKCTCPDPVPHEGPGIPVLRPGKSHRRGCPVVNDIFEMQDRAAREVAEKFSGHGILQTPGEKALDEVRDLRARVERLENRGAVGN